MSANCGKLEPARKKKDTQPRGRCCGFSSAQDCRPKGYDISFYNSCPMSVLFVVKDPDCVRVLNILF